MNKTELGPGLKYDENKDRWDLLPIECVEDIVKVLTMGAAKYSSNNWQNVENGEDRYYAALLRHLVAHRKGETIDPESGMLHLAHVATNAIFLMWLEKNKKNVCTNKSLTGYIDYVESIIRNGVMNNEDSVTLYSKDLFGSDRIYKLVYELCKRGYDIKLDNDNIIVKINQNEKR